jgi:hypothetical protein
MSCWTSTLVSGALHPGSAPLWCRSTIVKSMQTRCKPAAKRKAASVRQSVTMPAALAREVRRVAKERKVTMSRALVTLAERGVEAEAEARARLTAAYYQFMAEGDPAKKSEVGEDLIRNIFGKAAIAKDPLR